MQICLSTKTKSHSHITKKHPYLTVQSEAISSDRPEQRQPSGPSGPTLSRAKFKLDLLIMFCRQFEWKVQGTENSVVALCFSAEFSCHRHSRSDSGYFLLLY